MKKRHARLLAVLTASAMVVCAMPDVMPARLSLSAAAYGLDIQTTADGFTYYVSGETSVVIKGYTGTETELVIPSEIEGLPVTEIAMDAFGNNEAITSVIIPDSVTDIGSDAFKDCKSLRKVTMPAGLEMMGRYAFSGTSITEITIPAGFQKAYTNDAPFEDCDTLRKVIFADGLETIPAKLFRNAHCLREVVVPDSVTRVEESAFENCGQLEEFPFREGLTFLGRCAFSGTAIKEVSFPLSLMEKTSTCDSAFSGCDTLRKVTFPDGIEKIPVGCLCGAGGNIEVSIPDSVTIICDDAFLNCGIEHIDLHEGIEQIGLHAFTRSGLKEVKLPSTLTLATYSFDYCADLKKVEFAEGTEEILFRCLADSNGVEEVIIPDSVKKINNEAFIGTTALKSIKLNDGLERIGISAFEKSGITSIVMPDSVTDTSVGIFEDCQNLRTATIGSGDILLGSSMFAGCSSLKTVTIPDEGVMALGSSVFSGCSSLEEIVYNGEPLEFGDYCFSGCYALNDEKYVHLNRENTYLSPEIKGAVVDNNAEFTVSFEVPEEYTPDNGLYELRINLPTSSPKLDNSTITVESGTLGGRSVTAGPAASTYFSSNSGSMTFSLYAGYASDFSFNVSLEFKMNGTKYNLPVGKSILSVGNMYVSIPEETNSLKTSAVGIGPRGQKVDIYMDDEVIASPVCDEETGKFKFDVVLTEGTADGSSFVLCAKYGDTKTDDMTLTYKTGAHVIKSLKMNTYDPDYEVELTDTFSNDSIRCIPCTSSNNTVFTLDISNPETISKASVVFHRSDDPDEYPMTYDEASGLWKAECNLGSYTYGKIYGFNIALLTKEEADAGQKLDIENNCYYSSKIPTGIKGYSTGKVYEGAHSNGIPGAVCTLYQVDADGNETEWKSGLYQQDNPFVCDSKGYFSWSLPENNRWKVKCTVEGYEPAESKIFDTNTSNLNRNADVVLVSTDPGEVTDAVYDEKHDQLLLTFGKYMIPASVNYHNVTAEGAEACWIEPSYHNKDDKYTDTFIVHGRFSDMDKVTLKVGTGCLTYAGTENTLPYEKTIIIGGDNPPETTATTASGGFSVPTTTEAAPASTAAAETAPATSTATEAITTAETTTAVSAASAETETAATSEEGTATAPATTAEPVTEPPVPEGTPGDINGDGLIDASDASEVLLEYAKTATGAEPSLSKYVADVNGDGRVDSSDATLILAYYAENAVGGEKSFEDFIKENI